MAPRLRVCTGDDVLAELDALAALRCAVFRDWPYLYDGDAAYETRYLRRFAETPGAAIVLVEDRGRAVGASTCLPLIAEGAAVRDPFAGAGHAVAHTFYFGESVLLPAYRNRGFGVAFFAERERHARTHAATHAAFCAVRRADTDPRRPAGAVSLDAFWRKRGFAPAGFACAMAWREVGAAAETDHVLDVWGKTL